MKMQCCWKKKRETMWSKEIQIHEKEHPQKYIYDHQKQDIYTLYEEWSTLERCTLETYSQVYENYMDKGKENMRNQTL